MRLIIALAAVTGFDRYNNCCLNQNYCRCCAYQDRSACA